jgi:curved DNA-binding protein CbpA
MQDDNFEDFYELLRILPTATREEVRDAWLFELRHWHPDVNRKKAVQYQEQAERMATKLNKAYEILSNAELRTAYDEIYKDWQIHKSLAKVSESNLDHPYAPNPLHPKPNANSDDQRLHRLQVRINNSSLLGSAFRESFNVTRKRRSPQSSSLKGMISRTQTGRTDKELESYEEALKISAVFRTRAVGDRCELHLFVSNGNALPIRAEVFGVLYRGTERWMLPSTHAFLETDSKGPAKFEFLRNLLLGDGVELEVFARVGGFGGPVNVEQFPLHLRLQILDG